MLNGGKKIYSNAVYINRNYFYTAIFTTFMQETRIENKPQNYVPIVTLYHTLSIFLEKS